MEFTRLRPVICRMLEDSEADQAQLFLRQLHPACSLIDEANRLTREIRPQDNLAFELAVMQTAVPESVQYCGTNGESPVRSSRSSPIRRSAPFSPKSAHSAAESPRKGGMPVEEPVLPMTLVVRLIQRPPPKIGTEDMVKWRKAVNDVVEKIRARKRLEPHAVSPTLSTSVHGLSQEVADLLGISPSRDAEPLHNALSDGSGHIKAGAALPTAPTEISVWSFAKFEQRLSQIRDIHRLTTGDDCIDLEHYLADNPGGDPWRDWGPQSVSAMLYRIADLERRLEHAISERGREEQIRALREQVIALDAEHLASRKLDLEKDLREIEKIEQIEVKAYASKYSA